MSKNFLHIAGRIQIGPFYSKQNCVRFSHWVEQEFLELSYNFFPVSIGTHQHNEYGKNAALK